VVAEAEQANRIGRFDAVIHNAGALHGPGIFAVNTVAPYLLTALMARPDRSIFLSSSMHARRSGSPPPTRPPSARARAATGFIAGRGNRTRRRATPRSRTNFSGGSKHTPA
jgi:hypothetical protein